MVIVMLVVIYKGINRKGQDDLDKICNYRNSDNSLAYKIQIKSERKGDNGYERKE